MSIATIAYGAPAYVVATVRQPFPPRLVSPNLAVSHASPCLPASHHPVATNRPASQASLHPVSQVPLVTFDGAPGTTFTFNELNDPVMAHGRVGRYTYSREGVMNLVM